MRKSREDISELRSVSTLGVIVSNTVLFDNRDDALEYGDARAIAEEIEARKMVDDFVEKIVNKIAGSILK